MQTKNVLIADYQRLFADSLREFLKNHFHFNQVEVCYSFTEAKEKMHQTGYHILFMEPFIPGFNTQEYLRQFLQLNPDLAIVSVSSNKDAFFIQQLFGAGIQGYISKSAGSREIGEALKAVETGEKFISSDLTGNLATAISVKSSKNLTDKELEILRLVANGLTIAEAAGEMNLSPHTIIGHRRNIMHKIGVRSATEMTKYAFENKLM